MTLGASGRGVFRARFIVAGFVAADAVGVNCLSMELHLFSGGQLRSVLAFRRQARFRVAFGATLNVVARFQTQRFVGCIVVAFAAADFVILGVLLMAEVRDAFGMSAVDLVLHLDVIDESGSSVNTGSQKKACHGYDSDD